MSDRDCTTKTPRMDRVSVRMPPDMVETLDEQVKQQGLYTDRSELLRAIVRQYIRQNGGGDTATGARND